MNKKIFTLLASALMLFTVAFHASARSVAEKSVGVYVKSLPEKGEGMFHIQVDSICVPDTWVGGITGSLIWIPVTDSIANSPGLGNFYHAGAGVTPEYGFTPTTGHRQDTVILSVTESGNVKMISARDLMDEMEDGDANLMDLQAAMWCVEVEDRASAGQPHTFHFKNKVFNQNLDWDQIGTTFVGGEDNGWMFSSSLTNINRHWPLYQLNPEDVGKGVYRVIVAELDATTGMPTGYLETKYVDTYEFTKDTVLGMLKVSLVKVSPYVLTAEEFNSRMYNEKGDDPILLKFNKTIDDNVLSNYLYAEQSKGAHPWMRDDYLNLQVYDKDDKTKLLGYVGNSNQLVADDKNKYANKEGFQHLKLQIVENPGTKLGSDFFDFNYSYRFVYFPSEDSLVINAFFVQHDKHLSYASEDYSDNDVYLTDGTKPDFYYGLYNGDIEDYLIVRYQDLNNNYDSAKNMMTIGKHPGNVNISFGISCTEELEGWLVPEGVYTIWDDRGRCLGVRIYNGTYSPQWLDLKDGECPDRIPAYQWVVEQWKNSPNRISLHNREFGHLDISTEKVSMESILVTRASSQIFKNQHQFQYGPIAADLQDLKYEPINNGWVTGQLLNPIPADGCNVKSSASGFRPVTNAYVKDEFLGYKHFNVEKDPLNPSYGKSEDHGDEKGMDYNAFAFKYLQNYNENRGISLEPRYNDTLLRVEDVPTGFRFMLGTKLRTTWHEEEFGYPKTAWSKRIITDDYFYADSEFAKDSIFTYQQDSVPILRRYYYELKVADFYNFRDGLAEQYVVLKGAGSPTTNHGTDWRNELYYGVADVYAEKDPFKFANVYLRETYFLPREIELGEERKIQDPSRRVYYVLLDRIETEQIERVIEMGLPITDTLYAHDGVTGYNLVSLAVEDLPLWINAQGRVGSSARVSAFSLSNINYELYRRLRSLEDDVVVKDGEETPTGLDLDAPKTLRIYRDANPEVFMHEDALSDPSYGLGINFLGAANATMYPEKESLDGSINYNYHLFIDTAYINRGTGPIKPQYLIAVNPLIFDGDSIEVGTENCTDVPIKDLLDPYIYARYLINATDSSRVIGSNGDYNATIRDERYIMAPRYDRLVFVPAIHTDDRLYIISELERAGLKLEDYTEKNEDDETKPYFSAKKLRKLAEDGKIKARRPNASNEYGAYYDFEEWNNYHNDVTFSLRFVKPEAKNADTLGVDAPGITNDTKKFYIESETKQRTPYGNPKIAPVQGGWVKLHNNVAVLSRTEYDNAIQLAEIFNVQKPTRWQDGYATSTDNPDATVSVIAGTNEVTILNATGKRVTVSNILGQTIADVKLSSDNQTIAAAKGVVVVTIEGEKAVKAVVK